MANDVKSGELVSTEEKALTSDAIPDFIPVGEATGAEHITKEDVRMPRLAIAQGLSPQMIEGNKEYIPELKLGHLFNTLTGQVYGRGPLEFAIIRADKPRWVEFDGDRNMLDPNVPANDPRTLWRVDPETKERKPPVATQFYDYICVLMETGEPIAISLARTGISAAKKLNGLIKMRVPPVPLYARRFKVETVIEKNDKGSFGVYVFKSTGIPLKPNSDLVTDKSTFDILKAMHESFKDTVIDIDRDAHGDDEGSFNYGANAEGDGKM